MVDGVGGGGGGGVGGSIFKITRDAGGVPGLLLAENLFSEEAERHYFECTGAEETSLEHPGDKGRADALRARVTAQKKHWPERTPDGEDFTHVEQAEAKVRSEHLLGLMEAAPATRARMPREWAGWPDAAKDALYRSGGSGGSGGGGGGGGGASCGGYGLPAGYGDGGGGAAAGASTATAAQRRLREDDEAEDLAAALLASSKEEAARRAAAKKQRLGGAPVGGPAAGAAGGEGGDVVEVLVEEDVVEILEEDAGSEAEKGSVGGVVEVLEEDAGL
jgi:hypothetical protein